MHAVLQSSNPPSKMTSPVWTVFSKAGKKVKCRECQLELVHDSKNGSTSNMKKHLERRHLELYKKLFKYNQSESESSNQPKVIDLLKSRQPLKADSPKARRLTHGLLKMICLDLQPLSFTEDIGFRYLMSQAEPLYSIPSRATVRNKLLPELYNDILARLKNDISMHMDKNGAVSITTDAWSSKTMSSYITYTLHYIRSDFTLASYNIGTFEYRDGHTAANLKAHVFYALQFCGVLPPSADAHMSESSTETERKAYNIYSGNDNDNDEAEHGIHSDADTEEAGPDAEALPAIPPGVMIFVTSDNASNITKAMEDTDFTHIKCLAHTVNLAVQSGFKVNAVSKTVARVRSVVKHFRKSGKAKYALQVSSNSHYCSIVIVYLNCEC